MVRIGTRNDRKLLKECLAIAQESLCKKMKYGAILITHATNLKYDGVNGQVPGELDLVNPVQCDHCLRADILSGTQHERCYALHAEQVALMHCLLEEDVPHGGFMYVSGFYVDTGKTFIYNEPGFYCTTCVRMLRGAGVSTVVVPVSTEWALLNSYLPTSKPNDYTAAITENWLPVRLPIEHAWEFAYAVAIGRQQAPGGAFLNITQDN